MIFFLPSLECCDFFFFFKAEKILLVIQATLGTQHVVQVGFKLTLYMILPPKCWGYRPVTLLSSADVHSIDRVAVTL